MEAPVEHRLEVSSVYAQNDFLDHAPVNGVGVDCSWRSVEKLQSQRKISQALPQGNIASESLQRITFKILWLRSTALQILEEDHATHDVWGVICVVLDKDVAERHVITLAMGKSYAEDIDRSHSGSRVCVGRRCGIKVLAPSEPPISCNYLRKS